MRIWHVVALTAAMAGAGAYGVARPSGAQPDYPWDRHLLQVFTARSDQNLVLAAHNRWLVPEREVRAGQTRLDEFRQQWRCVSEVTPAGVALWDVQWARPQPWDVPERWPDALRRDDALAESTIKRILDEQPSTEQWLTLAGAVPGRRRELTRLADGRTSGALHFWLTLSRAGRAAATRYPIPSGFRVDLDRLGLPYERLTAGERSALQPLLHRYYLSPRRAGMLASAPGGDWSRVPRERRPPLTADEPLYLYVSQTQAGEQILAPRTFRPPSPRPPGSPPGLPIWVSTRLKWDITVPRFAAQPTRSRWEVSGRAALEFWKKPGKGTAGFSLTRPLPEILTSLGKSWGETLEAERELEEQNLTLLLSGVPATDLKQLIATALHARWKEIGPLRFRLELTAEARKEREAEQRLALLNDIARHSNGVERRELARALEAEFPADKVDELKELAAKDPDAGMIVSLFDFPPGLQRRLADQAYYEGWFDRTRTRTPRDTWVDFSRLDEVQVAFRYRDGEVQLQNFLLPLIGGGSMGYGAPK